MLKTKKLLDLSKTIAYDLLLKTEYPWEILYSIRDFILELGRSLSPNEYFSLDKDIWISKDVYIEKSAKILGPVIIQKNTEIRNCAFIRGNTIIGENVVVGNSTEIKNSILFNDTQVPHFNYIGDSVLGYKSHLGAGVIISNIKSDKSDISINFLDKKINTKLKKFGAIIGDYSEIGCNTVLNPGTVISKNCTVYPLSMVRKFLPENSIFKSENKIFKKITVYCYD
ncbi:MAG: UDP-N-acetylglucosamine pyrophosphorylase [Candidatus Paraimprobicoccus trichonymphae]|uniref:UDP-N-acetylglucosamine pyrophosphorylase n=1 Tax=Candidatus Paraimprobicoccus trichonymphae TaxID=3033793 RepID=A0AA48KZI4_9FIRM|nr:MAG: UDP-N-acetylglucosamine pyrophosphorylase [Candidatus Paraimprobicoccus trichonymphae]